MTSIADRNKAEFVRQAIFYAGVFAGSTVVSVIARFAEERLGLLWREFVTRRAVKLYLANGTYYRLDASGELANPDQRIAEDVRAFTVTTLSFVLMLLNGTFHDHRFFRRAVGHQSFAVHPGGLVCGLRFVGDDGPRAPARQAKPRSAGQGGEFPLRANSCSRKRRIDHARASRGATDSAFAGSVRRIGRQLSPDHRHQSQRGILHHGLQLAHPDHSGPDRRSVFHARRRRVRRGHPVGDGVLVTGGRVLVDCHAVPVDLDLCRRSRPAQFHVGGHRAAANVCRVDHRDCRGGGPASLRTADPACLDERRPTAERIVDINPGRDPRAH